MEKYLFLGGTTMSREEELITKLMFDEATEDELCELKEMGIQIINVANEGD